MKRVTMRVPDVSCGHCERTIKRALGGTPGVRAVDVDIPGKSVTVAYDETSVDLERLKAVLADEEYPVASAAGEDA